MTGDGAGVHTVVVQQEDEEVELREKETIHEASLTPVWAEVSVLKGSAAVSVEDRNVITAA